MNSQKSSVQTRQAGFGLSTVLWLVAIFSFGIGISVANAQPQSQFVDSESAMTQSNDKESTPEPDQRQTKEQQQDITPFKDDMQKSMYLDLVTELRCPKCQNQNIADSNAVIAQDMRVKTKELLDEGYSKQEVIDYMVNRYGQFAHYQPPLTLATSILWFVPVAFILFCIVMLIQKSQGRKVKQSDADVADRELNALLDDKPADSSSQSTPKS